MDLLDYTKEDLEKLSTKELEELYHQCEMMQEQKSTGQLTKKVLINGLYGALANKAFVLFNEKIAQSITGNGRYFIQKTANMIEDTLQAKLPSPNKYVVYGDTDSVRGNTIISTKGEDITIADLYNKGYDEVEYKEGKYLKKFDADALCYTENGLEYSPIKYVMKHRVKKHMYRITANGKSVVVTEDHSVMVKRMIQGKEELISVKPLEMKKGDKVITL